MNTLYIHVRQLNKVRFHNIQTETYTKKIQLCINILYKSIQFTGLDQQAVEKSPMFTSKEAQKQTGSSASAS